MEVAHARITIAASKPVLLACVCLFGGDCFAAFGEHVEAMRKFGQLGCVFERCVLAIRSVACANCKLHNASAENLRSPECTQFGRKGGGVIRGEGAV